MPAGERIFLKDMNWDYIVIDEASMVALSYITYVLYAKTPIKFIIAGDPFQIEPITLCDLWKNENIYKMVELNSFSNPTTVPHKYEVKLLTTQYRSIPSVGTIFSELAYDGILKHFRSESQRKQIDFGNKLELKSLNLIKYPTSTFESIYKSKRLQNKTPYHIYSAVFVNEFIMFLSTLINKYNKEEVTIGVVAPYRAQANIIEKMLMAYKTPSNIRVNVGTIHGFQGDEADIMLAVFNTPPTISDSNELFLNRLNIINVAVSRARDYLIVIMPDNNTPNIGDLTLVKKVERFIKSNDEYKEYSSKELEELMFEDSNYIDDNTFVTTHQSINVYSQSDKKYEIRAEDYAIDVQLTFNKSKNILVYNDKYGNGMLIKQETNSEGVIIATIQFEDGQQIKYSLSKALASGALKIINN
jgi:superfamily I DNA and/or RNA helicase